MKRTLSPSGAPVKFRDLFCGLKAELFNDDSIRIFKKQVADYFGCNNIFLLSSGKAALFQILKAISSFSDRKDIIIPAYSSFCLASTVAASGLSVKLCDVDLKYLDFDLEHLSRLVDEKTLAVIPVHLFGLVARLDEISEITRSKGAFLIEDAAQAAGAEYNGQCVGTIGDAGIYSLGRGKSISTVHGGIIVSKKNDLANVIAENVRKLPFTKVPNKFSMLFTAFAITFFLRPEFYFIPNSLPFLKLGANIYAPDFKSFSFSKLQAGIGKKNFIKLDSYNMQRMKNARLLSKSLINTNKVALPQIAKKTQPCFIRFPVICMDSKSRDRKFYELNKAGLGISKNFPFPLSKIKEFKKYIVNSNDGFPNSKKLCEILLTLPTHPFVKKKDLMNMVEIISL
ncbi:hypothetical protein BuS5_00040 [Desulfosarcina sp. BuS5]|uniref:DegT/DnrJ/EryC1/StrS family aminotransferase n=1 Tax=Desulfosarcina sp. BuS5 TaxID=933262 RepID=UPI000685E63F|nr:DegT/DnrJ/EryC1/StrS family aminotransferase [Desulfosarcina sp. BuS5]WDN87072.1 hypothetical protein BuS5_00040 [Desulfosarcina sp. BuS5]